MDSKRNDSSRTRIAKRTRIVVLFTLLLICSHFLIFKIFIQDSSFQRYISRLKESRSNGIGLNLPFSNHSIPNLNESKDQIESKNQTESQNQIETKSEPNLGSASESNLNPESDLQTKVDSEIESSDLKITSEPKPINENISESKSTDENDSEPNPTNEDILESKSTDENDSESKLTNKNDSEPKPTNENISESKSTDENISESKLTDGNDPESDLQSIWKSKINEESKFRTNSKSSGSIKNMKKGEIIRNKKKKNYMNKNKNKNKKKYINNYKSKYNKKKIDYSSKGTDQSVSNGDSTPVIDQINLNRPFRDPKLEKDLFPESNESQTKSNSFTSLSDVDWKLRLQHLHPSPLPLTHPCSSFPTLVQKQTEDTSSLRSCPICFLPTESSSHLKNSKLLHKKFPHLKQLTYVNESQLSGQNILNLESWKRFDGHPSLYDTKKSFRVREDMEVYCGFVWKSTELQMSAEDDEFMKNCKDVVVVSANFGGNMDSIRQPLDMDSNASLNFNSEICFVMFVDSLTLTTLTETESSVKNETLYFKSWRIILLRNLPYNNMKRNEEIPKLLTHRLFPNSKHSIWMNSNLNLKFHPYQILERFLWRGNYEFGIPNHSHRFGLVDEANAIKESNNKLSSLIDDQLNAYHEDGMMMNYSDMKLPIISDVPDSSLLIKSHTPLTNLFSCLWFNEVVRFSVRDQLSFGYVRDQILSQVAWRLNMFSNCEFQTLVQNDSSRTQI